MPKPKWAAAVIALALLTGCAPGGGEVVGDGTGYVAADGSVVIIDQSQRQPATDLVATTVDGANSWKLSSERNKIVLLNTWGPWCAPCRKELPILQDLYEKYSAEGLQIVGLATRTNQPAVETFVADNQITFLQLADYDSSVMVQLEGVPSTTVPSTVFIDREGRIAGWALGEIEAALLRSVTLSLLEETS